MNRRDRIVSIFVTLGRWPRQVNTLSLSIKSTVAVAAAVAVAVANVHKPLSGRLQLRILTKGDDSVQLTSSFR
jgi:hypothetical protein